MRAKVIPAGRVTGRTVTGRSVESIARTHFGRDAEVIQSHSEVHDPALVEWQVVRTDQHGAHVLGRIVEHRRPPGRPPVHPVARTAGVLVRYTPAEREAVKAAAVAAGLTVNDFVVRRTTTPEETPDA